MRNFQLEYKNRQNGRLTQPVSIFAENQSTAAFLVDMFLIENKVDNVDFKSVKLTEVNLN